MDPVTQGVVGAAFAQTRGPKRDLAKAALIGALAGMAADLDILIRSPSDPLLVIDYHRQFTHSIFFIPLGALLCTLVFHPLLARRWKLNFRQVYLWSLLGYATHGLLDTCTTYGTMLLWPLSHTRYSFDIVSVVDPLFTVPLLVSVIASMKRRSRSYLGWGLAWMVLYLAVGYAQHERALDLGSELAETRGDKVIRIQAKPSFANLVIWKVIYETEGYYHVAAVKPGPGSRRIWEGVSVEKLVPSRDFPWLATDSQQAQDIERFRRASDGYMARDPRNAHRLGDIRYSLLPQDATPLWGIELDATAPSDAHVRTYAHRENPGEAGRRLLQMLFE
ncbi:MAG: metal-dependent hydrolase [Gammaproteobacteria bacterium]